jgi:ABC-type Fe3+ transport system substrate-binding protein
MGVMMKNEYAVLVKGFKEQDQAEAFIKWFEGQGEQDANIWFEEQDFKVRTDLKLTYPISNRNLEYGSVLECVTSELYLDIEELYLDIEEFQDEF